jgi:hypothetical protein
MQIPTQPNAEIPSHRPLHRSSAPTVSQVRFDIPGLETKGELLIVAIVSADNRSGLYCASIPDTTPELVQPARDTLKQLQVAG